MPAHVFLEAYLLLYFLLYELYMKLGNLSSFAIICVHEEVAKRINMRLEKK